MSIHNPPDYWGHPLGIGDVVVVTHNKRDIKNVGKVINVMPWGNRPDGQTMATYEVQLPDETIRQFEWPELVKVGSEGFDYMYDLLIRAQNRINYQQNLHTRVDHMGVTSKIEPLPKPRCTKNRRTFL